MLLVITSIDLAAFKKVAYTVSDPDKRLVTKQLMDPRGKFKPLWWRRIRQCHNSFRWKPNSTKYTFYSYEMVLVITSVDWVFKKDGYSQGLIC